MNRTELHSLLHYLFEDGKYNRTPIRACSGCSFEVIIKAEQKLAEEIVKGDLYTVRRSSNEWTPTRTNQPVYNWTIWNTTKSVFKVSEQSASLMIAARLACWYKVYQWWQERKGE